MPLFHGHPVFTSRCVAVLYRYVSSWAKSLTGLSSMDQSITERRGYTGLAKETATNLVSGQRRLALPDLRTRLRACYKFRGSYGSEPTFNSSWWLTAGFTGVPSSLPFYQHTFGRQLQQFAESHWTKLLVTCPKKSEIAIGCSFYM